MKGGTNEREYKVGGEARKVMQEEVKARREDKHRPYCLHPGSKTLHEFRDTRILLNYLLKNIIPKIGERNSTGVYPQFKISSQCP